MGILEDLGDGGSGDTSERGRTVAWVLGGLGCGSDKAVGSERTGFVDFLCLDLGEG